MNGLKTPYKISLDFYRRNVISVNAKQLDSESRYIEITCTDNGKKVVLDNTTTSAFIRYKKSDGYYVLNEAEITDTGIVNVKLTQQMLSSQGRNIVDVMLINTTDLTLERVEDIINSERLEGVSILSTMSFYIHVEPTAIDHSEIASSYKYDELLDGLSKFVATEQIMTKLEEDLTFNEEERKRNETSRQEAETDRVEAETKREIAENGEYDKDGNLIKDGRNQAEEKRVNAETQRIEAEKLRDIAENGEYDEDGNLIKDGRVQATQKVVAMAYEATERANEAAQGCESVIGGSGIILQDEKGNPNGVATLDEDTLIPNDQINTQFETQLRESIESGEPFDVILGKIYAYMETVNEMSQKHTEENQNIPILMASSSTPTEGNSYESYYNTGVTINPSTKSVGANSGDFSEHITIGNVTMTYENDTEQRIVFSFK